MKNSEEIVYQLSVVDIQEVAVELLERRLTKKEVVLVADSVGNYIDWPQAIKNAIFNRIDVK